MFRHNDENPVLVDFGLVRDLSQESLTMSWVSSGPGTPFFMAPEQLTNNKPLITWKTDQFALGIVVAICLTGHHPFSANGDHSNTFLNRVAEKQHCSQWYSDFLKAHKLTYLLKMIEPWPIHRYSSINDILAAAEEAE